MKSAAEILWENETLRLKRESDEAEWQKLVVAARAPVWLGVLGVAAWWVMFGPMIYSTVGSRFSPAYSLWVFSAIALMGWQTLARRRERALQQIIAREAPALAEKLRQERVF
jgi:hypothetical protein